MGKGKAKVVPQERRDFRSERFNNSNRPRRDYIEQSGSTGAQTVHAMFRKPLHKIKLFRQARSRREAETSAASP